MTGIGTLNESPLHAALKESYRRPGDEVEVPTEGFVADLRNGDSIIEIQTGSFSAMRNKFDTLLDRYEILLVHPIAQTKYVLKHDKDGNQLSRRKSPKRGVLSDICRELSSFPMLLSHPHFTLDVVMADIEEVRSPNATAKRRRGDLAVEYRQLIETKEVYHFTEPDDLLQILPPQLPDTFTTKDIATGLGVSRNKAQNVAYCLRTAEAIYEVDRSKAGIRYRRFEA